MGGMFLCYVTITSQRIRLLRCSFAGFSVIPLAPSLRDILEGSFHTLLNVKAVLPPLVLFQVSGCYVSLSLGLLLISLSPSPWGYLEGSFSYVI